MLFFKRKEIPLTEFFTDTFVDIHSHLLPGIDDGAQDIEDSIKLISKMYSYGIKNFITTPHVLGEIYPNSTQTILSKLEEVKKALKENGFDEVNISAAAEYMLDEQFLKRLASDDILVLKNKYILVEIPYFNAPENLHEVLFEIQLKGYKPILAHPERYNYYHNDFENYYELKKMGCFFQLNILSLTGYYNKYIQKISQKLLELNMYDFVGTDTHRSTHLEIMKKVAIDKNMELLKGLLDRNSVFNF